MDKAHTSSWLWHTPASHAVFSRLSVKVTAFTKLVTVLRDRSLKGHLSIAQVFQGAESQISSTGAVWFPQELVSPLGIWVTLHTQLVTYADFSQSALMTAGKFPKEFWLHAFNAALKATQAVQAKGWEKRGKPNTSNEKKKMWLQTDKWGNHLPQGVGHTHHCGWKHSPPVLVPQSTPGWALECVESFKHACVPTEFKPEPTGYSQA